MEDKLDAILSQLDGEQLLSLDADFAIDPTYLRVFEPHLLSSSDQQQPHLAIDALPSQARFDFKSDEEVQQVQKSAIPKNTEKNTTWAVNIIIMEGLECSM